MGLVRLISIWILNVVVLFYASILAVYGDGTSDFAERVLWVGGTLIALSALLSLRERKKKSLVTAFVLSASALPMGFVGFLLYLSASDFLRRTAPLDDRFVAECQSTGTTLFEKPQHEIRSIAYDWPEGSSAPAFTHYEMDANANYHSQRGGLLMIQKSLDFTESRCCRFEGVRMEKNMPYYRRPGETKTHISELTADALVFYEHTLISEGGPTSWSRYSINVSDRRSGRKLANLTYVVDSGNKKACAGAGVQIIDESEFVSRAIGSL